MSKDKGTPEPTADTKYRLATATLLATRPVNFFLPHTDVPYKDENGCLVDDPRRVEVLLSTDEGIQAYTVLKGALTAERGQVNVVFASIPGYNEDREFVYAIGKA